MSNKELEKEYTGEPIADMSLFKIGKMNYHPSEINWKEFGIAAESACKKYGRTYYIKDGLRAEMEKE